MQELKVPVGIEGRITIVKENAKTGEREVIEATNLVTTAGLQHYAERIAQGFGNGTPGTAFARVVLGTAGSTPAAGSQYSAISAVVSNSVKAFESGYPKANDTDTANTGKGAGVLTYKVAYATGEANDSNIDRVAITIASPVSGSALLMYATVTPFTKTSNDTLTVYINHTPASP